MKDLIKKLYHTPFFSNLFHTSVHELQNELKGCRTVLDLGCGYSSPLEYCPNIKFSVGVEPFMPYLLKSKQKGIHTRYLSKKIEDLNFKENSFDAVIMIEVLEHLPKKTGEIILKKIEKWAKKKIIISSPNGYIHQKALDNNPLQKHLSGWDYDEMSSRGYKVRGLAGIKILRQEAPVNIMGDDLTVSIRFRPRLFWFIVASLSQIFVYYLPRLAFELISVKDKQRANAH